jgi:hypothetical protein
MVLDRTHRARHDLDWLPPSFKVIRWSVAGTLWGAMAGLLGSMFFIAKPGFFIYGKGIAVLFAGGYYAGDRAAKAVLRGRLAKLAHGRLDLTRLASASDGELVHVRGRVKAEKTIPGVLTGEPCVYRRVIFSLGGERWVHEAAEDFRLVDGSGENAMVQVGDAHLIAAEPKRAKLEGEQASAVIDLTLDPQFRGRPTDPILRVTHKGPGRNRGQITGGELVIRDGDEVELVGYKTRSVDVTVQERLARETPLRATLRSGKELPLLVAPIK